MMEVRCVLGNDIVFERQLLFLCYRPFEVCEEVLYYLFSSVFKLLLTLFYKKKAKRT